MLLELGLLPDRTGSDSRLTGGLLDRPAPGQQAFDRLEALPLVGGRWMSLERGSGLFRPFFLDCLKWSRVGRREGLAQRGEDGVRALEIAFEGFAQVFKL
ncbi:hypothetical protein DAETH_38790 (plasmid) [Deinococcus aetherius]|uniref:Uncharacterized protein n=1 Tax=Deinococcus aetherius TaxID=200252 RepID=A0ABM8AJN7_9DEIO|nr:hypothetical protein DAETH_38790 [Deinococcus aetherius]